MSRGRRLAWEVRPRPPPPHFFQNVVIPLGLPFRVGKRCDSKGVKYKSGKLGFGYGIGMMDGIRRSEGSAKSGCIGRMGSFANLHIYIFYRASKEGLVEKWAKPQRAQRHPESRCASCRDIRDAESALRARCSFLAIRTRRYEATDLRSSPLGFLLVLSIWADFLSCPRDRLSLRKSFSS